MKTYPHKDLYMNAHSSFICSSPNVHQQENGYTNYLENITLFSNKRNTLLIYTTEINPKLHERSQTRKEDIPFIRNYRKCELIYSDKKEIPRRFPWGWGEEKTERDYKATQENFWGLSVCCLSRW